MNVLFCIKNREFVSPCIYISRLANSTTNVYTSESFWKILQDLACDITKKQCDFWHFSTFAILLYFESRSRLAKVSYLTLMKQSNSISWKINFICVPYTSSWNGTVFIFWVVKPLTKNSLIMQGKRFMTFGYYRTISTISTF